MDNNGIRSPLTHVAAVTVIDNEKLRVTPFDSAVSFYYIMFEMENVEKNEIFLICCLLFVDC